MKKVISLVLALVMIMSLATTAFAATVSNATSGHSYDAYQIFSGTQTATGAALGQIEWGSGVDDAALLAALKEDNDYFDSCTSAADVANVLAGKTDDCAEAKALANVAVNHLTSTKTAISGASVELDAGYYLLIDTTELAAGSSDALNSALLQVTNKGDVTITKKYSVPTPEKKILDNIDADADIEETDVNEASIGDTVNYKITAGMPSNIDDYEQYYYVFTDTLSKGLTANDDIAVSIDSVNVTDYFYKNIGTYDATNGTTIKIGIADILALELVDTDAETDGVQSLVDITKNSVVTITYSAELNENAVVAGTGNDNKVKLTYSNDPDDNGEGTTTPPTPGPGEPTPDKPTGESPEDVVVTYTTELTILKYVGNTDPKEALAGAEFTISGNGVNVVVVTGDAFVEDAAGTYYKLLDGTYTTTAPVDEDDPATDDKDEKTSQYYVPAVAGVYTKYKKETTAKVTNTDSAVKCFVNEDGTVTFTGLGVGTYKIEETVVPAGYNKAADIDFTVGFDYEAEKFTATGVTLEGDNTLYTEVANFAGSTLPETGGMGTTLFYVFGAAMVLGAAVLLVTKRRMIAE